VIVLGILRICESKYTKNTVVYQRMNQLHGGESFEMAPKIEDSRQSSSRPSPRIPPPAPPSEGVISRQTSIRTSIRPPSRLPQSPHHIQTYGHAARMPSLSMALNSTAEVSPILPDTRPNSPPVGHTIPSAGRPSSPEPAIGTVGYGIISDNSAESMAAAALVTDGPRLSGGGGAYQPGQATLPPYSPSSPIYPTEPSNSSNEFVPTRPEKGAPST
jgi:hypothetical protein